MNQAHETVKNYFDFEKMCEEGTFADLEVIIEAILFCFIFRLRVLVFAQQYGSWVIYKSLFDSQNHTMVALLHSNNHWEPITRLALTTTEGKNST